VRLVLIILVFLVMTALYALHAGLPADVGSRAALVFGFLLIAGFILGELITRAAVPRITGYLLAGMVCGPSLLGLVDRAVIEHLRLVDDLALVLIALTAGSELKSERLRARARSIVSITVSQTVLVFLAMGAALWLLRPLLTFCQGLSGPQFLSVVGVLALIATAKSPSTTVAVILEARSRGAITDTVLGATVLKDIVVLVGFSLVMFLALPHFTGAAGMGEELPSVGWVFLEIFISLGAGGAFGLLMILYLRYVKAERMLFVLATAFLVLSMCETFHLDPLLLAVVAGFVVSNFSRQGDAFTHGLEQASAPIFLIFFCLAGAGLNLGVLGGLWHVALIYVSLRGIFTWLGTAVGARLARDTDAVRRYAWTGFIGQAGVSLGLATLARKTFGEVGATLSDLVVGGIVINQLVGPILFRFSLLKTGEGRRD
jgi:Kef-type K+ transport system membrane component KefB